MSVEIFLVARCPEHGLHGCRERCFECGGFVEQVPMVEVGNPDDMEIIALWRPSAQHPWREWESDKSDEVHGEMRDFVPLADLAVAQRERDEAIEMLREMVAYADEVRAHYGIERVSGVAQPPTDWDHVQQDLHASARVARHLLARLCSSEETDRG